jgi:hypothetical protein
MQFMVFRPSSLRNHSSGLLASFSAPESAINDEDSVKKMANVNGMCRIMFPPFVLDLTGLARTSGRHSPRHGPHVLPAAIWPLGEKEDLAARRFIRFLCSTHGRYPPLAVR